MARQTTTTRRRATARSRTHAAQRAKRPSSRSSSSRRGPKPKTASSRQALPIGVSTNAVTAAEQAAIQRFFDGFTQALTSGDGRAAAQCFEYPALMVMSAVGDYGGNQPLQDQPSVAAFFDRAPEQYQAKGVHQTTANLEGIHWVADDLALVRAHFPYLDEDGNDLGDGETSLYLLRRTPDDYAICAAITLGVDSDLAQS